MTTDKKEKASSIVYSCYLNRNREGEQFVSEHTFRYQLSGSLLLSDGKKEHTLKEGSFGIIKRNHLLKFMKLPPENGEYKSLSVYFDQETLKQFSMEYNVAPEKKQSGEPILQLKPNALLEAYADSVLRYHATNNLGNKALVALKLKEGLLTLLQTNPELKNSLFDFSEPHKIDLEAFMNKNFHFNVNLERFAYLTGRSLATFKRDFDAIFKSTPGRWILQKRLQEAYYLIKEKGKTASDIYLDLGFEDLSHFSFAFKKAFGEAPSRLFN